VATIMNLDLFERHQRIAAPVDLFADLPAGRQLRWYQEEAVAAAREALKENRSTLLVCATGTGKTALASEIVREWPGRVLWLAHRDELLRDAREELETATGETVAIEKAGERSTSERIVVGSVQTVQSDARMDELRKKGQFDLIVFDEAHHAPAASFRKPLDFFAEAKLIGLTATPDRGDEKALGQVFDSVAYVFDIQDGIETGYLVPVRGKEVTRQEIDISQVSTTKGDLAQGQLDEAMLKAAEGICHDVLRLLPTEQTIVFTPGVKTARYIAEKLNTLKPLSAASADGKTDEDERRSIVKRFRAGEIQYLVNCQIFTEGFDAPNAQAIVIARPTKSRALFCQMLGRGTRVLPGVVDDLPTDKGSALLRHEAIAASRKPHMLILDFVGNAGRHSLVSVVDALGGKYTEAEVEQAKRKKKSNPDADPMALLRDAREELRRLAKATKAQVKSLVRDFDPFRVLHIDMERQAQAEMRFGYKPPSEPQLKFLKRLAIPITPGLSGTAASKLISAAIIRERKGLASVRQLEILARHGVTRINLSHERALEAIKYIDRRNGKPEAKALDEILSRRKEAGEEG
jgi:superfamily II DNA or RNA helicase